MDANAQSARNSVRTQTWVALVITLALLVAGLVVYASGHGGRSAVALSVSPDGSLLLAVCADISVGKYYASQRGSDDWTRVWEGHGGTEIVKGTVLEFGSSTPELTTVTFLPPDLDQRTEISIHLLEANGAGSIAAYFPARQLRSLDDGSWYLTDGTVVDDPCAFNEAPSTPIQAPPEDDHWPTYY